LFDAEAPVYTRARYLPPSKIEQSDIRDSILSDGCIVDGARIANSVVGLRSRISKGVQMDVSFMMGADYYQTLEEMSRDLIAGGPRVGIGENTIIKRAIIDKNARIGSNARLVNEAGIANLATCGGAGSDRGRCCSESRCKHLTTHRRLGDLVERVVLLLR
jgi:glucose-1-phosphate adenylyltransferase